MAKIVLTSAHSKAKAGSRGSAVTEKRIRDVGGQVKTLRTLDARSKTFGSDFQYVFSKNVAKARRENKRATGAADFAIAKR